MMLTFKIRHGKDLSKELRQAKQVAEFALRTRSRSSKDVKHIGLKGVIANQILRKYSCDKRAKQVKRVKLAVPGQSIKFDKENREIKISLLDLTMPYQFRNDFKKINQIELGNEYAYVSVTIEEPAVTPVTNYIGVDRNTTGHCVVIANPATGKVLKLGKSAEHTHKKYSKLRRKFQKAGELGKLKAVKRREHNIIKDLNHKISKKVVEVAKENNCGIRMEKLEGIRKTKKQTRSFRYSLNSWSFYQQQSMVDYKAKLQGVPTFYDEPAFTSQVCSRCGLLGVRSGKEFECPGCGHVDHADSNASFNIALGSERMSRLNAERDAFNGRTDAPREATA
ncbi:MAG: Transposase related protein [Candidatus Gottesmanbacteria bacterium GW2011_GWB1_49_7]|uniref:Transposase related protein n=1 Tax=Candidatus Gottesmanbacteria bacterium GW2011_GWB1_49_7 TaxID=1618448 RepID=A0A0G1Z1I8_9BACT|nr:MAG: Transposase related protein [Candidatus Gottesmanbacteria bacterium GW2011_GWB1_49_7]